MGRPELFSYLSAFITIVLAVALTNVLQSVSVLIQDRRRVRWDARPLVFTALVALVVVSEFFSVWFSLSLDRITFWRLLWLLAVPTLFALLAYTALPNAVPEQGIDLGQFYLDERRVWVILFALASVIDFIRVYEVDSRHGFGFTAYLRFVGGRDLLIVAALAVIYIARSRRWSWLGLGMLAFAIVAAIGSWTISLPASR